MELQESIREYRKQMTKGVIPKAYRGIMDTMMALRRHFSQKYPGDIVSGSIYTGFMDMTYFAIMPESLKERSLKIAIVFIHESVRFEAWLSGANKQVQARYWKFFKENGWNQYTLVPEIKGRDSILEFILDEDPDFDDLAGLTDRIERKTLRFTQDVENFLSLHNPI